MEVCYICNVITDDWHRNLSEIHSQHTNTRINDMLKRILGDFKMKRPLDDENNCICSNCFNRIDEYDWTCVIAKQHEKELRDLIIKTDTIRENIFYEISNVNDPLYEIESEIKDKVESIETSNNDAECYEIECTTRQTGRRKRRKNMKYAEQDNEDETNDIDTEDDNAEIQCNTSDEEYLPKQQTKKKSYKRGTSKSMTRANFNADNFEDNNKLKNVEAKSFRETSRYRCSNCNESFALKSALLSHQKWHKRQQFPEFKCRICSFILSDQDSFDSHLKLHGSKSSSLQCVFCNMISSTPGNLKRHTRIHKGTPNHICDLCGKAFVHDTSFKIHMQFHLNNRPFKCPKCPMKFVLDSNLNRHMQTHNKVKKFMCKVCGNRFGYSSNLKEHEKMHSGTDKKHKCSFCDAQFARHSKMVQHMNKHHFVS